MKQNPDEKAAAAAAELRGLIRQAHEAAKQLAQQHKALTAAVAAAAELINSACVEQVQPLVDDFKLDTERKLVDYLARCSDILTDKLHVQLQHWNQDIMDIYALPPDRGGVVIDLRAEVPRMVVQGTPEAAAILKDAPYQVIVNPTEADVKRSAGTGGAAS